MSVVFHKMFVVVQSLYPIQERIDSEFFNLRKSVFKLYETFKKFNKSKEEQFQQFTDTKVRMLAFNAGRSDPGDDGTNQDEST